MLTRTTLYACAACGVHVRRDDLRCPHCDAPMRSTAGGIPQTRTAMAMGLSFLAITSAMSGCNKIDAESGAGGDGGAGGEGAAEQTSTTKATSTKSAVSAMSVASTYGTGFTEDCDSIGVCDGRSPNTSCIECSLHGSPSASLPYADAGSCRFAYEQCFGETGDCSDGEAECCQLDACLGGCNADPAGYWTCACGSDDASTCTPTKAPVGSCFGDHPLGTDLTYGSGGWRTCALGHCVTSCD